ncbi:FadR/GntR family transcriptional regulator [Arthrobacter woluwensis]|uniref:DNA-binding transcriptional regulator, FadR family n=1 Tax=Arthrobacter woluwensis TaxID=156980 RepID=A0A1H4JRS2_9MICC|nr:FCD domain-containing protein [Arthrobacter woluwensis]SEB48857.1 DNA-binding transcriptional regulator, FadR family [Arthrobacter woluwensis]
MSLSTSTPDEPVDRLRRLLRAGEWPVGAKIPNDAALAGILSASPTAVREAVRYLVHTGLLESLPGKGTFVRAVTELPGLVGEWVKDELTLHAIEAREALESYAVRLAADRITDQQIAELRSVLRAREVAGDAEAVASADVAFHRLIVRATGNSLMVEMYEGLDRERVFDFTVLPEISPEESLHSEHAELLDALADHDVAGSVRAVERLLAHVRIKVLRAQG